MRRDVTAGVDARIWALPAVDTAEPRGATPPPPWWVLGILDLPVHVARKAEIGMDGEVERRRARICGWLWWRRPGWGGPPAAVGLREMRERRGGRCGAAWEGNAVGGRVSTVKCIIYKGSKIWTIRSTIDGRKESGYLGRYGLLCLLYSFSFFFLLHCCKVTFKTNYIIRTNIFLYIIVCQIKNWWIPKFHNSSRCTNFILVISPTLFKLFI
jgi:hypothetical protein